MLYKNAVLFIVGSATRELNIYRNNWVVSKPYVNSDDYRAYKEGKEELCNIYCESDFKHIRTILAFSVDF